EETVYRYPVTGFVLAAFGVGLLIWMGVGVLGAPWWTALFVLIAGTLVVRSLRRTYKATLANGEIEFRSVLGRAIVPLGSVVTITAMRHGDGNTAYVIEMSESTATIEGTHGGRRFVDALLGSNPSIERRGRWPR